MNATMSSALNIQFLMVSIAEMFEDDLLTISKGFLLLKSQCYYDWVWNDSVCVSQVACVMGLLLISFGAEGAPSKHPQKKANHRSSEESDPSSSYRLILDPEFKSSANPIHPINNDSISPWTYT